MPASCLSIHVPFVGRSNPTSERFVVVYAKSPDIRTIRIAPSYDSSLRWHVGCGVAESIPALCSAGGQLGPQQGRSRAPPAFPRVDASRTVSVFVTRQNASSLEHYGNPPSRPSLRRPDGGQPSRLHWHRHRLL